MQPFAAAASATSVLTRHSGPGIAAMVPILVRLIGPDLMSFGTSSDGSQAAPANHPPEACFPPGQAVSLTVLIRDNTSPNLILPRGGHPDGAILVENLLRRFTPTHGKMPHQ